MNISSNATFKTKTWTITYKFFPVIAAITPSCKCYSVSRLNVEFDQKYKILGRCPDVSSISSIRRRQGRQRSQVHDCADALCFLPAGS